MLEFAMAGEEGRDLLFAFLAFQRADREHQQSVRLDHARGAFQQIVGSGRLRHHIGRALDPGQVGMPPDGARGGAGRIQQHQRRGAVEIAHIAFDHSADNLSAGQIFAQPCRARGLAARPR